MGFFYIAMPKRRRSSSSLSHKEIPPKKEEDLLPEPSQEEEEEAGEVENSSSGEDHPIPHELPATLVGASSDEEEIALDENTVGDVPMHWYDEYEHIGYNIEGEKIARPARKDQLDAFLDREDKSHWKRVWDEKNQREVILTAEEMRVLRNLQKGKFPEASYNPYQEFPEIPRPDLAIHPLVNTPEPKSRFLPSKWEAKKIAYLVKAIRRGWITFPEDEVDDQPQYSLIWDDEDSTEESKRMKMHIPPPPSQLPKHNESYNPPEEYLLTEEEQKAWELLDPTDRPFNFLPQKFDRLRHVPSYERTIEERFTRCLDLYLCPRKMINRAKVDPDSLLPKLPSPKDLQPFPTTLALRFEGHTDKVRTISVNPTGQWLLSGGDDRTVRMWEIASGRCMQTWTFEGIVNKVAWNPNKNLPIFLVAIGKEVAIVNPNIGSDDQSIQIDALLSGPIKPSHRKTYVNWTQPDGKNYPSQVRLVVSHGKKVEDISWHYRGDYFSCVSPQAVKTAVLIHRISQRQSQNPFKRMKGQVQCAVFHPSKAFFFVATQRSVRVYNLTQQVFVKKLLGAAQLISSLSVHPGGDNLLIGSYDKRVCWYDMDFSDKPYRTLKYHKRAVRQVAFHPRYPLFASASDDGTAHVFHGMVYNDFMQNPLLVPLKILRGHTIVDDLCILDCAFHPTQPWLLTAGADSSIFLYT